MAETVEMKDWQRGIALDTLKEYAAIFKAAHGPHVYGAFGLVNEREIADAMTSGGFVAIPGATCLFHTLKVNSQQETYHETTVAFDEGDAVISDFACTDEIAGGALLRGLTKRLAAPATHAEALFGATKPTAVWLEIFEEDELARALALSAGYRYVDTKILAGSEIKGIYVYGKNVPAFEDPAEFQTLAVLQPDFLSAVDLQLIADELRAYGDHWAQHYSTYNKKQAWTAFALQGYDANDPGFIIQPNEMSRKWKAENAVRLEATSVPTIAAQHFPNTLAIAARLNTTFDRIRFMRLAPGGGELARHADLCPEAGVKDGRLARIHIPIETNPDVIFTQWNSRGAQVEKHFPQAALCYIDQRQPHRAINGGTTDRVHFVLDTKCTPALRKMIAEGK